jgi:hypothetical protein
MVFVKEISRNFLQKSLMMAGFNSAKATTYSTKEYEVTYQFLLHN